MDKRFVLNSVQLGISIVPILLSVLFLFLHTYLLVIIAGIMIPLVACFAPLFRKRANLWTFVFVSAVSVPINIRTVFALRNTDLIFFYDTLFMNILQGILVFCIMFSVEQIIMGVIVAVIRDIRAAVNKA